MPSTATSLMLFVHMGTTSVPKLGKRDQCPISSGLYALLPLHLGQHSEKCKRKVGGSFLSTCLQVTIQDNGSGSPPRISPLGCSLANCPTVHQHISHLESRQPDCCPSLPPQNQAESNLSERVCSRSLYNSSVVEPYSWIQTSERQSRTF